MSHPLFTEYRFQVPTLTRRVLRVIGYPPLPEDYDTSKGLSCGAHTDYGCLTFLLADDFPGALQGGFIS